MAGRLGTMPRIRFGFSFERQASIVVLAREGESDFLKGHNDVLGNESSESVPYDARSILHALNLFRP